MTFILSGIPATPPTLNVIALTDDSVTLEWTIPHDDGGSPIINYVIDSRELHSPAWTTTMKVEPTETMCHIHYLHENTYYFFRVAAENSEGIGEYRDLVEPVRPRRPKSKCPV